MKVLVLGATGFIGGHIAKEAIAQGWDVRGLRRDPQSTGHLDEAAAIEWISGDLDDGESLMRAMRGIDILFHAAAYYPKRGRAKLVPQRIREARQQINTVIEAAKAGGVRRLVYTSTLSTIGHPPAGENRLADERDIYQLGAMPKSAYYETKAVMEQAALAANDGLEVVVTNPTAVFGPGDVHLTLGAVLIAAARGYAVGYLPVDINVIDVRDVAKAHLAAAMQGAAGERYILGGHNLSVAAAMTIAAAVGGAAPPRFRVSLKLIDVIVWLGDRLPFIPLPANHLRTAKLWQAYNTDKAERQLGLQARSFTETVADALAWFKIHGYY